MQKDILLVEDDYELAQTLLELLEENDYSVDVAYSYEEALDASFQNSYRLYIFDINLDKENGIELLQSLREADDVTEAIFISAMVDLDSIAQAFDAGGSDYLKKPFFPEELLIRVNAKLQQKQKKIVYKSLEYDPKTKQLYHNGKVEFLSEVQECLLHTFLTRLDVVIPKEELMECLVHPSSTALRVALNKLKQTLGIDIQNKRGVGYIVSKD